MIHADATLGLLVSEQPSRADVFERLRLDYCCGGDQTLAEACARAGLDIETVCRILDALEDSQPERWPREANDWRRASIAELCDHIVRAHHDNLREELPRIDELLARVVRVHGARHPELHDLQRTFGAIRDQLESHIETEERVLFPACRAAESSGEAVDESVLALHEQEHTDSGEAFAALRELADDYDAERALCGTHRRLLDGLHRLELDLHQHVHEENNILFPRVRALR